MQVMQARIVSVENDSDMTKEEGIETVYDGPSHVVICMVVALHLAEGKKCLMVGDLQTGYMVVPDSAMLHTELEDRCTQTGRNPAEWVFSHRLRYSTTEFEIKIP
jgi:predicted RNase H-like nuclease